MRIDWTAPALRDLSAMRAYIGLDNPAAAAKQIDLVIKAASALVQFPNLGRPGRRPRTRELLVPHAAYLLAYRVDGDRVQILRVLHCRQRWPDGFS